MISEGKAWIKNFQEKPNKDKLIFLIPYVVSCAAVARVVELWRLCNGNLLMFIKNIAYVYSVFPPSFDAMDLEIGIIVGIAIIQTVKWDNKMHSKNERHGEEYGSARWGNSMDIKPFIDENPGLSQSLCKPSN